MRRNVVKQRLCGGEAAIGTWLSLGSPLGAEWMAHQGFNWLGIEQQHGPVDPALTTSLVQAIRTTDVAPLVRLPWSESLTIRRALDAGAHGLCFPTIETGEEAALCVKATACASAGRVAPDNDRHDVLVVVMIETALGLRNVDAILSVPGVDACMIGPSELCVALGLEPDVEPRDRRFFEAIEGVYAACRRYDVAPGLHVRTPERAIRHLDAGWQLVAVASDGELMARAASTVAATIRAQIKSGAERRQRSEPADPERAPGPGADWTDGRSLMERLTS